MGFFNQRPFICCLYSYMLPTFGRNGTGAEATQQEQNFSVVHIPLSKLKVPSSTLKLLPTLTKTPYELHRQLSGETSSGGQHDLLTAEPGLVRKWRAPI